MSLRAENFTIHEIDTGLVGPMQEAVPGPGTKIPHAVGQLNLHRNYRGLKPMLHNKDAAQPKRKKKTDTGLTVTP